MTRKDYVWFAEMFKHNKPEPGEEGKHLWWKMVCITADGFQADNPAFDRVKFYNACGFKEK